MRKKRIRNYLWLLLLAALFSVAVIPFKKNNHALAATTRWVTFDACGGTASYTSKQVTVGSTYGSLPTASRAGYTFLGWYTASGTSGTAVTVSTKVTNQVNHKLYAHWKAKTCTIVFNSNGGSGSTTSRTFYQGSTLGSLPAGPTPPTGKNFVGWYTAASGGTRYYASSTAPYQNTMTLYAHYAWNIYTITFNGNGATGGSMSGIPCTYGSTYTLTSNKYINPGYSFIGWNTAANGSGKSYSNGQKVSNLVSANGGKITLYAQWKRLYCTVSFNSNGGYGTVSGRSYAQGGAFSSLPAGPSAPSGKRFVGWFSAPTGGFQYLTSSTVPFQSTLTLYARWADIPQVTISFDYNNNSNEYPTRTYTAGQPYSTFPAINNTPSGYYFDGWYTSKNGGTKVLPTTIVDGHVSRLYAHWERIQITVTFDPNVSSQTAVTKTFYANDRFVFPADPEPPAGYHFDGWYTAKTGGVRLTTNTIITGDYSGMRIYAQYTKNCPINVIVKYPDHGPGFPNNDEWFFYSYHEVALSGETVAQFLSRTEGVYQSNRYTLSYVPNKFYDDPYSVTGAYPCDPSMRIVTPMTILLIEFQN